MTLSGKKVFIIILAALLLVSLGFNGWMAYQISLLVDAYEVQQTNAKTIAFTRMFVEKVLMAEQEIDFDTRLTLETSVRNLDDQQIFGQWQAFVKSETKEEASKQAKLLLFLLTNKISD